MTAVDINGKDFPQIKILPPIEKEILADRDTPVSVFEKINQGEYGFLLESVEGGERWGRYSFLGFDPFLVFRLQEGRITITSPGSAPGQPGILGGPWTGPVGKGNPLFSLRELFRSCNFSPTPGQALPRFFGGGVGYFSYDLVRYLERLPELRPVPKENLNFPDAALIFTESLVVFDNVRKTLKVMVTPVSRNGEGGSGARRMASARIEEILDLIRSRAPVRKPGNPDGGADTRRGIGDRALIEECPGADFQSAVREAKDLIAAGEIIQVVLSRRWRKTYRQDPFDIYRALRFLNPSPYMFYLRLGSETLVGASPEALVRVEDGEIYTRPIAGTRPRGQDPAGDEALGRELLNDEKERAEHVMLVDLGRNDVGRVAEIGTVRTNQFMEIEKYSHVMHLVSEVQGKLRAGQDAFDVLSAVFPAGTVSGAPKIRAMEIIEELEKDRRGPYAGSVGYIGYTGNMDMCITIRSIFLKDGQAVFQSGAGIVADSDPARETCETEEKAEAMFRALELAGGGMD
ncbi:MAG: anthranilate synthase component I [bacterium]|nr:anthranilate synthase component I [bacterium]